MPYPCCGPSASRTFNTIRSSVPWRTSDFCASVLFSLDMPKKIRLYHWNVHRYTRFRPKPPKKNAHTLVSLGSGRLGKRMENGMATRKAMASKKNTIPSQATYEVSQEERER